MAVSAGWHLVSKWPVYNDEDEIIGTFGTSKYLNETERSTLPYRELNAPIEYIRQNFTKAITVKQLAASSHLSVSALERRFRKHLSKTPRQYITDTRLEFARHRLLESNQNQARTANGSVANSSIRVKCSKPVFDLRS